ncbi:MAG: alkaline phosphatase [Oscillochloris sp.]|nr:alkaline phosphatase [Oscillochloris sp.]
MRRGLRLVLSLPAAILSSCGHDRSRSGSLGTTDHTPTPSATATRSTVFDPIASVPGHTPTPTATQLPASPTRFAIIGDYGMAGEAEAAVANLVIGWSPDFIITTGDNNYPEGSAETIDLNIGQYYHAFIAPYQGSYGEGSAENRFFPVLGNHDWIPGYPEPYLSYFHLPGNGRYYRLDREPLSFFMLDSMPDEPDGTAPDSIQGQWLQAELATTTARWKVVVMHHAPLSSGLHGSSGWMQWPFAAWGAQLVLAGHDHTYERISHDGITYVVNGLGGGARYAPGENPVEGSQVFFNAEHGALLVEADESHLHMQFITRTGEVIDSMTLV